MSNQNDIEDEFQFIFKCPFYEELKRNLLINLLNKYIIYHIQLKFYKFC